MLALSPCTHLLIVAGLMGGPEVLVVAALGLLLAAIQIKRWRGAKATLVTDPARWPNPFGLHLTAADGQVAPAGKSLVVRLRATPTGTPIA